MVFRRTRARPHRGLSNQQLQGRLQFSVSINRGNLEFSLRRKALQNEIEELAVDAAARRQRVIRKPRRTSPRAERIVAPVQTMSLFSRRVLPILRALGRVLITGSGTFTVEELANAEYRVFFHTEGGFFVEARMAPGEPPVYSSVTTEQANLLRQDMPPPELLARLFTESGPVDH